MPNHDAFRKHRTLRQSTPDGLRLTVKWSTVPLWLLRVLDLLIGKVPTFFVHRNSSKMSNLWLQPSSKSRRSRHAARKTTRSARSALRGLL